MKIQYAATVIASMLCITALAQHDMKDMPGMEHMHTTDTMSGKTMKNMDEMQGMSSSLSLHLPMNRDASGTSWQPDASPIYSYMVHANDWMFMFHGDIFIRYNRQDIYRDGYRGAEKWDAPDMLMAMGQRPVGQNGLFHFSAMFSTDALIAGGSGYPLLYQTGESWNGKPLVDRQHPHDLFSELSVSYAYSFSHKADLFVYVGYPGEPALGPVTFMHRPSGSFTPDAPIGHHWEDATHITFGVATLGLRYGMFKLEGSSFTGREPDENRYNFDKPLFDSRSARLSFNPSQNWAIQVSHGFIKSPEALHPGEDVYRSTASITYVDKANENKYIAATILFGQNTGKRTNASDALLAEVAKKMKRLAVYGRYEWIQKSAEELGYGPTVVQPDLLYIGNTLTLGAQYDILVKSPVQLALGGQVSVFHAEELTGIYGTYPFSGEVFLHIYPRAMK